MMEDGNNGNNDVDGSIQQQQSMRDFLKLVETTILPSLVTCDYFQENPFSSAMVSVSGSVYSFVYICLYSTTVTTLP